MKYPVIFKIALVCALMLAAAFATSDAQMIHSARSLGMADAYMLPVENCEAAGLNPANLGSPDGRGFSLKVASAAAHFANNAFTLADYNRYNGEYLTEADKNDILSKIPEDGLVFDFDASASVFSFTYASLAFTAAGVGGGRGSVSKDPIELALMGNKIGEVHTAGDSDADGWAALSFGVSYASRLYDSGDLKVDGGITLKYLQGLEYYGVAELEAQAVTEETGFTGEGGLTTLEAHGGSGYGVDLGIVINSNTARFGLVARNAIASLNWNNDVEKTLYNFRFEGVNVENAGDDSISVSDEIKLPADQFSTRPPLELEASMSRQFGKLLGAASLRQGFENTAFVSKTPRLAAGIEYPLLAAISVRSGLAAGGVDEYSAAVGGGFSLGVVQIDLAYASTGTLLPFGGRGSRLAFSTILEF